MDIEKLKQKILDLAIRGKLVPQDPNDEPSYVLIEKIREEKAKLVKEGKIKASKEESYIYKGSDNCYYEKIGNKVVDITDEIPFDIPYGWQFVRMNSVLDVRDGTHDSPKYYDDGIPFVTSKNLKNGEIDFSSCKYISLEDSLKFNERSRVDNYDILFAMIGTIGNPTVVKKDREFSIKNVALFKNINRSLLSEIWVKFVLESVTSKMKHDAQGGLQPFVSLDFLRNYLMPIPPQNEQTKILNRLKKLDGIVSTINSNFDSLNILVESAKRKILDEIFGENSSYKSYYPSISVKDVCKLDNGVEQFAGILPYLEAKVIRGSKKPKYLDKGIFISKGTTIILVDGENSGEIMQPKFDGYMGSTFKILKIDTSKINEEYISLFIFYKKQELRESKTGSAIPHLNKKIFNNYSLPLPNITKQVEIVTRIQNIFKVLDSII